MLCLCEGIMCFHFCSNVLGLMTAYRGRLLLVGMQIVINLTVDIYQLKITMVPIKWKLHYTNNDDSSAARGPEPGTKLFPPPYCCGADWWGIMIIQSTGEYWSCLPGHNDLGYKYIACPHDYDVTTQTNINPSSHLHTWYKYIVPYLVCQRE